MSVFDYARLKALSSELRRPLNSLLVLSDDNDAIEWPQPALADEEHDPLYNSTRGYLEQIERCHRHRNGGAR